MTRARKSELIDFDLEIERTFHRLNNQQREIMEEEDQNIEAQRSLRDYASPSVVGIASSIRRPTVQANNFEIKSAIIQMRQATVQFGGSVNDDPNAHIANFLEICDTFKHNRVSDDAIRLRLFPFSLRDKAKAWLSSLPPGSITTGDVMAQKFLAKYFPPSKTAKMRNDITTFVQFEIETLYEAWERFKELLRKCPHHQLHVWLQVQTFYNGLSSTNRSMIDAAAEGTIMRKTPDEAYELLDEMASNSYQWQADRLPMRRPTIGHEVSNISSLSAQVAALNAKLDNLCNPSMPTRSITCDLCGAVGHSSVECQMGNTFANVLESANFVGNFHRQQHNPYSNVYNPGWRNHPNLSWSNHNAINHQAPSRFQPQQEKKPSLEELMTKFVNTAETRFQGMETKFQNQEASI
ncbi:uncharacterized protein LOC127808573 [Diospyros lotus]|uniref:uncharacterized protein LOC127808573 n=1 Tax=Diospyros lotus TaxID=55363 RepID=UPI00224E9616|nr:uncharacterized protein LOC127808573 [Diospyros lotus]